MRPSSQIGFTVDQIGIIVSDLRAAMDGYIASFGIAFHVFEVDETMARFSGSSRTFRTRFALGQLAGSSIELIEPVSGTTIHSEHLDAHGPGIHHLGVYAFDIRRSRARLEQRGYRLLMEGAIDGVADFAYYHAPDLGTVLEPLQLSARLPLFLARRARLYRG